MVAIVSGALLSDIDVVFVGRTRERDLNAVCKKTQNTHNDWDERSVRGEREDRTKHSSTRKRGARGRIDNDFWKEERRIYDRFEHV